MEWIKVFSNETEARQKIAPDKPQLLILNGKRLCLILHNNIFFVMQDACPHNGASLSKGTVNHVGEVICPLHNYQYDLQSGKEYGARARDLKTFPIKSDESGFFVGL